MKTTNAARRRCTPLLALALALSSALPADLAASGLLLPKEPALPPLAIKNQRVEIQVADGVATASVEQVFLNTTQRNLEAVYVFPLPAGAAVSDFAMMVNGKRTSGEVIEKDKARKIYQDIVRRARDPGLLEHLGDDLFRASVFPIAGGAEQRISLTYSQVLPFDGGLYRLVYPLKTGEKASRTLEDFTVGVRLNSKTPLKSIYSPSHEIGVSRKGDHQAVIGFEEEGGLLDRDFVLYYGVSEKRFGLNLLTYAEPDKEGYFLMLIAPAVTTPEDLRVERDVTFVFDTSGSMYGDKIVQAREALSYCISRLGKGDRFNIVRFSTEAEPLSASLLPATEENRAKADGFVKEFVARGGTAIDDALRLALEMERGEKAATRPYTVVFLTDGKPTIGESDLEVIVKNVAARRPENTRVFVFGVGHQVNTHLLDRISGEHGGVSRYIEPKEDIEMKVSSFYDKISTPVLSRPSVSADGLKLKMLHPRELGDLFAGEQITLAGRYAGGSDHAIRLTGEVNGERRTFVYEGTFPRNETASPDIARLWATRRVGYLVDQIRLHGEQGELREEVVRLGQEFGIVTPYTSYLILEDEKAWRDNGIARAETRSGRRQHADRGRDGRAAGGRRPEGRADGDLSDLADRPADSAAPGEPIDSFGLASRLRARGEEERGGEADDGAKRFADFALQRELNKDAAPAAPAGSASVAGGATTTATPAEEAPPPASAAIPLFIVDEENERQLAEKAAREPSPDADLDGVAARATGQAEAKNQSASPGLLGSFYRNDGAEAIAISQALAAYKSKERAQSTDASRTIRYIGRRIFYLIRGTWTDRDFKAEMKITNLTYASEAYFDFLLKNPKLTQAFALGESVIVVLDDKVTAVRVVPEKPGGAKPAKK